MPIECRCKCGRLLLLALPAQGGMGRNDRRGFGCRGGRGCVDYAPPDMADDTSACAPYSGIGMAPCVGGGGGGGGEL